MSRLGSSSIVRRKGRCMNMFHSLALGLCSPMSALYVHGLPSAVTVYDQQVRSIRGRQDFSSKHGWRSST